MQQPNRRNKVKLQVPFEDTLLLGSFLLSSFYQQHIENLGRKSLCLSVLYLSTFVHRLDSTQLNCSTYYDKPQLSSLSLSFSHTSNSTNTFPAFFILAFSQPQTMIQRSHHYRRNHLHAVSPVTSGRALALHTFPPESRTGELVRRRGGLISVPMKLWQPPETHRRMTKLLLNVTIERSLGPVQVVMSPENTVSDLIKAAVEIYVREKRRPLVKETDPHRFELHYSQFSLESKQALWLLWRGVPWMVAVFKACN